MVVVVGSPLLVPLDVTAAAEVTDGILDEQRYCPSRPLNLDLQVITTESATVSGSTTLYESRESCCDCHQIQWTCPSSLGMN